MTIHDLELDPDPAAARTQLEQASRERPVVVFKHSPICPVSDRALRQFRRVLGALPEAGELGVAHLDVIAERALARGLTAELGVEHQLRGVEFPGFRNQREHDVERASRRGLEQRARLDLEQPLAFQRDAQSAPAHRRILFAFAVVMAVGMCAVDEAL